MTNTEQTSHFIQFCRSVEDNLPTRITDSEWYAKGGAADVFQDKYLLLEYNTYTVQNAATVITELYEIQNI